MNSDKKILTARLYAIDALLAHIRLSLDPLPENDSARSDMADRPLTSREIEGSLRLISKEVDDIRMRLAPNEIMFLTPDESNAVRDRFDQLATRYLTSLLEA